MLCHKEIRRISKEMAGAAYEELAKDGMFYKEYPKQKDFIARHWKNFIGHARSSLFQMLSGNYPESVKEEIFEIVVQDRTLQAVNDLEVKGSA